MGGYDTRTGELIRGSSTLNYLNAVQEAKSTGNFVPLRSGRRYHDLPSTGTFNPANLKQDVRMNQLQSQIDSLQQAEKDRLAREDDERKKEEIRKKEEEARRPLGSTGPLDTDILKHALG